MVKTVTNAAFEIVLNNYQNIFRFQLHKTKKIATVLKSCLNSINIDRQVSHVGVSSCVAICSISKILLRLTTSNYLPVYHWVCVCVCANLCRLVSCYAFLRRETWQRGREREREKEWKGEAETKWRCNGLHK